ncbi:hypothetical protein BGX29_003493 [Mortierella sp. GBA35]|nr:hypothetical protein BGX29_003493 [Mortierella sp. GBA35]
MKFISFISLISAAIVSVATAAPLVGQASGNVNVNTDVARDSIVKRHCSDCTHTDDATLIIIIKASADHYADIVHVRLDSLMREIATAKVSSGFEELPKEKALLTITVQSKIDDAKKACTWEKFNPAIKAAVTADANLDVVRSKQEDKELEKKMADLEVKITQLIVDRIQANINAESLSKDATEKMTNTEITPASETPALVPETPTTPERVEETTPKTTEPSTENNSKSGGLRVGIDVAAKVDPKFVCKSGCSDSQDAKDVLSLRINLENQLKPRLNHFYTKEVPTACNDKRASLLDGVLNLLSGLRIGAKADVKAHN